MNDTNIWDIVQYAISIVALIIAISKRPSEVKLMGGQAQEANGNASKTYAEAAKLAGERTAALEQENACLHKQNKELEERISACEEALEECKMTKEALARWAGLLNEQLISLGANPVPFGTQERRKKK